MNQQIESIVEDMALMPDWLDRYNYIIELSEELPALSEELKTPKNLISGCQSRVWIEVQADENGALHYRGSSDAIIVSGLLALLLMGVNGRSAEEVAAEEFEYLSALGLNENLSPTRANGVAAMKQRIKELAQR